MIRVVSAFRITLIATALACTAGESTERSGSAPPSADGPIALHNGPNSIDLLGDGSAAQVFVAWRGNYNAHGHSSATVYLRSRSDRTDSSPEWQVVPRFGGPGVEDGGQESLGTSEGADCTLQDFRLVLHRGGPAELVIARRELGASYADSAPTHFDYYQLMTNTKALVGWPPHYFQFVRTLDARRNYCDVNVAFEQELHLGRHGIGRGEASQQ